MFKEGFLGVGIRGRLGLIVGVGGPGGKAGLQTNPAWKGPVPSTKGSPQGDHLQPWRSAVGGAPSL